MLSIWQFPLTIQPMLQPVRRQFAALTRRQFLRSAVVSGAAAWAVQLLGSWAADFVTMPFENGKRPLVKYPQKRPLIRLTTRPPQLETPFAVFNEGAITPNDAFFVRYHLTTPPLEIDPEKFRVSITGKVSGPCVLSLAQLKSQFEAAEIVAVK